MSKAILISINPKWVAKILNGEKTIEIRKTCPTRFKNLKPYEGCSIDVYIYCTKGKPYLTYYRGACRNEYITHNDKKGLPLNSKVVAKFMLNNVEEIKLNFSARFFTKTFNEQEILQLSCLSQKDLENYLLSKGGCNNCLCGYAWHIDNLEIFDKPKEISEFKQYKKFSEIDYMLPIPRKETCERLVALNRAPQSWCYVEV